MVIFAILAVFSFSCLLAILKIPITIKFSDFFELYDEPDHYRKDHPNGVSRLGGLSIFSAFVLTLLMSVNLSSPELPPVLGSALLVFIIGLKDDIGYGLGPAEKLGLQLMVMLIWCFFGSGYFLESMTLSEQVFAVIWIIFMINAFNLIDGINGLAGGLGLFVHVVFGLFFLRMNNTQWAMISFSLAGAICGFLKYNFREGSIFMGDSGSMLIGVFSAFSAIKLMSLCGSSSLCGEMLWRSSSAVICLTVLIVPIFDTSRVFVLRLIQLKSPFIGDRNHIHHQLRAAGFSDQMIVLMLLVVNIGLLITSIYLAVFGVFVVTSVVVFVCIIANVMLSRMKDGAEKS